MALIDRDLRTPPFLLSLQIEECLVCSDVDANVLFRPCLHMVACDSEC